MGRARQTFHDDSVCERAVSYRCTPVVCTTSPNRVLEPGRGRPPQYVDDRLHSLGVMLTSDLREGLGPSLCTRTATLGSLMLIAGVLTETAGGLLALL